MDTRSIAAVLLKVAGLVLIGACVTQLPSYFPVRQGSNWSLAEGFIAAAITVGPAAILGACFWFFPGTIANKIVGAGPDSGQPFDLNAILVIAITVLGLFLIAHGVTDLIYHIATAVQMRRIDPNIAFMPPTIFAGGIASVVEALFGLCLCLGRRGTAQLVERMRGRAMEDRKE